MNSSEPKAGSYAAPAAACAVEVLRLLASSPSSLTVSEMARSLSRSKSLVYRVVHELEAREFVRRRSDHSYWLGLGVLEVGGAFAAKSDFSESVRSVARQLAKQTGETTNVGVLVENEILYLIREESLASPVTFAHPGIRLPAHCTALGKALLAELSDDSVRALLGESLTGLTPRSITSLDEVLAELEVIRVRGYASDEGETVLGRSCIAAAVALPERDVSKVALSLSVPTETFDAARESLVAQVLDAKARLERDGEARSSIGQTPSLAGLGER